MSVAIHAAGGRGHSEQSVMQLVRANVIRGPVKQTKTEQAGRIEACCLHGKVRCQPAPM
jgi:hypothetical protein